MLKNRHFLQPHSSWGIPEGVPGEILLLPNDDLPGSMAYPGGRVSSYLII